MIANKNGDNLSIPELDKYTKSFHEKHPRWINDIRKASLTRFTKLGIPTIKNEDWNR